MKFLFGLKILVRADPKARSIDEGCECDGKKFTCEAYSSRQADSPGDGCWVSLRMSDEDEKSTRRERSE